MLAAEDVRFDDHRGVDYAAIARAAWINYQAGRVVEGASTITQQVARNLLPAEIGSARNMRRKVREALLARDIEKRWTKRDILETYVEFVFLGEGAYGMAAASPTRTSTRTSPRSICRRPRCSRGSSRHPAGSTRSIIPTRRRPVATRSSRGWRAPA